MSEMLEVLKKAREKINNGWCQGDYVNEEGCVCTVGAVELTIGRESILFYPTLDFLTKFLPKYSDCVIYYNDHPSTTKEDILALFDKAIAAKEMEECK